MTLPETSDINSLTPQRPSKKLLAGMIISQILAILLIVGLAFLGIILMMLGGGLGWMMNWLFFSPILLLIPIIASWVCYARRNTKCASRLTYILWGLFLLDGIAIGLLVLYTVLISSGP